MQFWRINLMTSAALSLATLACNTVRTAGSDVKAVQGVPQIYAGHIDEGKGTMSFFEMDAHGQLVLDNAGVPKVRQTVRIKQDFAGKLTIMDMQGTALGPNLDSNPNVNYSWFSNDKSELWPCGDAEKMVGRAEAKDAGELDDSQSCFIDINTTGDYGVGVSIIGLPNGEGLREYVNTHIPALQNGPQIPLNVAAPLPYLKPGQVNVRMDVDAVGKAMMDVRDAFHSDQGASVQERNTCLMNQRAMEWPDAASHFYCQFPLYSSGSGKVPYRDCYSRELIAKKDTSPNPHMEAFTACWKNTDFFMDPTQGPARFKAYAYIMWVKQGGIDFNIEDENAAINKLYDVKDLDANSPTYDANKRPRRIVDTYPNWLPDQPRYNKIRALQKAMQDKLAAAARGANAPVAKPASGAGNP